MEELRKLLGIGLINRRPGYGFRSLEKAPPPKNIKDHFEITDAGLRFLKVREEVAAEEERQKQQAAG